MTAGWPWFPGIASSSGRRWLQPVSPEQRPYRRRRQLADDRANTRTALRKWWPRVGVAAMDSRGSDLGRGTSAEHRIRPPLSRRGRTTMLTSRGCRPKLAGRRLSPARRKYVTYSTCVRVTRMACPADHGPRVQLNQQICEIVSSSKLLVHKPHFEPDDRRKLLHYLPEIVAIVWQKWKRYCYYRVYTVYVNVEFYCTFFVLRFFRCFVRMRFIAYQSMREPDLSATA